MSEEDAFLYALEISLDSVRKREASAGAAAAGARSGDSSAAAGGGGGSGGRGGGVAHSGAAGASEEADEWEWQTVVPAARSRQEGARFPLSHPHLGSACKDTPGVQFEVDEYGRVRHFGAPAAASSAQVMALSAVVCESIRVFGRAAPRASDYGLFAGVRRRQGGWEGVSERVLASACLRVITSLAIREGA